MADADFCSLYWQNDIIYKRERESELHKTLSFSECFTLHQFETQILSLCTTLLVLTGIGRS
jgi:hypothetical protein